MAIFGHEWPLRPPMAGKSGTNGGSQWNTYGGTTIDEKLVRQMHPMVWKWPKMANFGPNALLFGHKRPQRPQRDGKSGTNGGSQ